MHRVMSGGLAIFVCLLASSVRADETDDKRLRFLVSALDSRVGELEKADIALPFLLDTLGALVSLPGYEKDPSKRVTVVCNVDSFTRDWNNFDYEKTQIKFPNKMIDTRLDTILKIVAEQVDGVVFVRHDNIEIISRSAAAKELRLQVAAEEPMPLLVNRFYTKTPLEKAMQQLSERYNQNIVLGPAAESKATTPITLRLTNAPIDAAIETMADMSELAVVRKSNIWYVTTREQASTLRGDKAKKSPKAKSAQAEKKSPPTARD